MTKLLEVEGSSLYAETFGSIFAISTNVEYNPHYTSRECALYLSRDGEIWTRTFPHQKDRCHKELFQYGTLVLPVALCDQSKGMFSGQAVMESHNIVTLLDFDEKDAHR
jgi:hypothetical protein